MKIRKKKMSDKPKKLTDKEEAFCQAYTGGEEGVRWNQTQSAIKAGYSTKSACEIGYENMRKPHIKARIGELCKEARDNNDELINRVLNGFKEMAFNEDDKGIKMRAMENLSKYLGMDKQHLDITTDGKALPISINIAGVKPE